jgi:recombinational DNA repair protein RecT
MALKTVLRLLLSKYGIMSIEMQQAFVHDVGPGVVEMADRKAGGTLDVEVQDVQEAIPEDATTTPSEVSVLFDVEAEKNGVEA